MPHPKTVLGEETTTARDLRAIVAHSASRMSSISRLFNHPGAEASPTTGTRTSVYADGSLSAALLETTHNRLPAAVGVIGASNQPRQ